MAEKVSTGKNYKKKKRKKKSGCAKPLFWMLIIALATFAVLSVTVLFPIKKISVKGKSRYSPDEIIDASGIIAGDNLFLPGKNVKTKITTKLPYIKSAVLLRELPDKLVIKVDEDKAQRCYFDGKNYLLADSQNKILEIGPVKPENMFIVYATVGKSSKAGKTVSIKDKTQQTAVDRILAEFNGSELLLNELNVTKNIDITLTVNNRFIVYLGDSADVDKKIKHMSAMIDELDETVTGEINLKNWSQGNKEGYFTNKSITPEATENAGDLPEQTPPQDAKE